MSADGAASTVKSSGRTLAVLEYLATAPRPCSLSELHVALGVPKSSLHGLLRTLHHYGWVETDESGTRFSIGVRALLVGTAYIDHDDVVARTREAMDWLVAETGETVHLARLDDTTVVYLATRDSPHDLRLFSRVGRRLPAHATSLGKALLATRTPEELEDLLPAELTRVTESTITDRSVLRAELARIRERGYALDSGETTNGVHCIGMALPLASPPRDAMSLSVPMVRFDAERQHELAQALASAIERVVGRHPIPQLWR